MKFDDILGALESDGKILNFKFQKSRIPMYLVIRFSLIQLLINKKFELSNPHIEPSSRTIGSTMKYVFYTLVANLFFAPKKEIYIFSSGIVNELRNSKYKNRLYDDFYQLFKNQTQIIESSTKLSYMLPKSEKIYFKDLIEIIIVLCSKFVKLKNEEMNEIDNFLKHLNENGLFDAHDATFGHIRKVLMKISKKASVSFWIYRQFLKIKKPKLIIVEDSHYFGHFALLSEAKKMGIKTAEYQHGYIGLAHPAYNYHKNIFDDIAIYLPEYFLTHGNYWSEVSRTPSRKISIGLAGLSSRIEVAIKKSQPTSKTLLFISGGTSFRKLCQLVEESVESLNGFGYDVLLRPHPSEILALNDRYSHLVELGVKIDTSGLYDILQKTEVVVGIEVSTVLYEAASFTNKVYLMNTEYTNFYEPRSVFIQFDDKNELVLKVQKRTIMQIDSTYFWDNKWKHNYECFIKEEIGLK